MIKLVQAEGATQWEAKAKTLHEQGILDNLQKRFIRNKIYTLAGEVLVSMNPYCELKDEDGVAHHRFEAHRRHTNSPRHLNLRPREVLTLTTTTPTTTYLLPSLPPLVHLQPSAF